MKCLYVHTLSSCHFNTRNQSIRFQSGAQLMIEKIKLPRPTIKNRLTGSIRSLISAHAIIFSKGAGLRGRRVRGD